jgi:NAD(P)-dependent dehydrogenase (short-subunit alcohol dehydrogenase family)
MTQQVVLVTGASSGIGQATAQHLAAKGYDVIAAARRLERLEAMRSANIAPLALDVTSEESIRAAVAHIKQRKGRLDVLVNNAGYALYGVLEEVTPEDVHQQFDVNVFGLMSMTQAVLPLMREQRSGIIVNLSSVAGKVSTPFAGWYSASKHAVEALSDALRAEVAPFGIQVVMMQPGSIKTEFGDIALNELQKASNLPAYRQTAAAFEKLIRNSYRNAPGPEVVAETIYRAIAGGQPRTRYAFPNDSRLFIFLRKWLPDRMFDRLLSAQMR